MGTQKVDTKEQSTNIREKKNNSNKKYSQTDLILIAILSLSMAALAFFGYIYFTSSNTDELKEDPTQQVNTNTPEQTETTTLTEFTGEYLKTKLPEGWTLKEYVDGENTAFLTGGVTYKGLTGFSIFDENNTRVFKVNGADGIGGTAYCENYYKFADYSASHFDERKALNAELGEPAPTVVDLSTQTYVQYNVLGVSWRRIENQFYLDLVDGNNTFETACDGLSMSIPAYKGISFDADGYKNTAYMTEILLTKTDTTNLEKLDIVLENLEVK